MPPKKPSTAGRPRTKLEPIKINHHAARSFGSNRAVPLTAGRNLMRGFIPHQAVELQPARTRARPAGGVGVGTPKCRDYRECCKASGPTYSVTETGFGVTATIRNFGLNGRRASQNHPWWGRREASPSNRN